MYSCGDHTKEGWGRTLEKVRRFLHEPEAGSGRRRAWRPPLSDSGGDQPANLQKREDALGLLTLAPELYGQLKARADVGEVDKLIGSLQAA